MKANRQAADSARMRKCPPVIPYDPYADARFARALRRSDHKEKTMKHTQERKALLARGAVDPTLLATVFPLARWRDALAAIQARSVVKALLDPRPGHENGAAP